MIFAKNFARNYEKKILGTSDAWWMSRLSQRPSNPAYYIEDCRILRAERFLKFEFRFFGPQPTALFGKSH